jgi:4a-hydroxytetrahydrobiopterin dehydratase
MSWTERDNALHREVRTPDFLTAYQLVGALLAPAEELQHHPDLELGWGYVRIHLTTHDAGGITDLDHRLAERLEAVIASFVSSLSHENPV